jgi:predicted adenine nucleotide alpha hydrolase (AANH) superfamily ATPase
VTEAGRPWEHVENHRRAYTQVFFLSKAELVLSSAAQKIPLAENRFLQALKRAENTNEKSRRCFMCNLFESHECTDMFPKKKKNLKIGIDFPSHVATKLIHQRVV